MMKDFLRHSSRHTSDSGRLRPVASRTLVVVGVVVLLVLLASIVAPLAEPASILARPAWTVANEIRELRHEFLNYFKSKRALIKENTAHRDRQETVEAQQITISALKEENEELRGLLGRFGESAESLVLAAILVRPSQSPYDTVIINAGSNLGVLEGAHVFLPGDVVLGEVAKVEQNSSRVQFYSSPGIRTQVTIGEENITATALGKGGGNFEISLPREIEVAVGETITVPGVTPFILGVIGEIEVRPADAFKKILLKTPANLQQLKWVHVQRK